MQNKDFSFLFDLEKSLHQFEVRSNVNELKKLLSPNFFEFGSSGNIWSFENILSRLPSEEKSPTVESFDYKYVILSPDVILVTYKTKSTLRSSIWKNNNGSWQMEFHQGTITAK